MHYAVAHILLLDLCHEVFQPVHASVVALRRLLHQQRRGHFLARLAEEELCL